MFKHYLITRLSEQDEVLRARYIANEKIFALVLGIVPEGNMQPHSCLTHKFNFIYFRIIVYDNFFCLVRKSLLPTEHIFFFSAISSLITFTFPSSGQAKVRESLSYTAYKNMLKNILRYKESVEPQDLQQFVILKDSLDLGKSLLSLRYVCLAYNVATRIVWNTQMRNTRNLEVLSLYYPEQTKRPPIKFLTRLQEAQL